MSDTDIKHAPVDVAAAELVKRMWDDHERCEFVVATVPSRRDPTRRHLVRGHASGRNATCSCWGFLRHHRCAHASAWMPILEELERQHYADRHRYSDEGLMALLDFYTSGPPLSDGQRLRMNGIRAALAERGIWYWGAPATLAEAESRRREQDRELYGE